ncbi:hypothetical protein K438DRAFT_81270 [Mycena galopus ATCC 62051]|nr:hypothetical protein K438DRAFT_81270 [Mycena galopus ATCC 62051]
MLSRMCLKAKRADFREHLLHSQVSSLVKEHRMSPNGIPADVEALEHLITSARHGVRWLSIVCIVQAGRSNPSIPTALLLLRTGRPFSCART